MGEAGTDKPLEILDLARGIYHGDGAFRTEPRRAAAQTASSSTFCCQS